MAWFLAKRGEKLEYALELARRADELNPGNISINDTLGWIYFHLAAVKHAMGDTESARALLDGVLAKYAQFESIDDARRLQARIAESGS